MNHEMSQRELLERKFLMARRALSETTSFSSSNEFADISNESFESTAEHHMQLLLDLIEILISNYRTEFGYSPFFELKVKEHIKLCDEWGKDSEEFLRTKP